MNATENNNSFQQSQGQTIQLLSIKANGKIQLNQSALDIIASYSDKPVGFVALVGKYRTGKSFLLNKLLFLQKNGFKVQQYTTACTQGIWMWTNPFLNQYLGNYLFFIDTQGLASMEKGQKNDIRILTLATLISSYMIYNTVGCIDQRSISDLNAITQLSKNIITEDRLTSVQNQQRLHEFMPKFCWVIRDFTLQLQDQRGRKITSKQYLQNCLKQDSSTQIRLTQNSKRIKKSLLTYFKDRDCLTLVRPARQQNQIQTLNRLPDVALRRQFLQGVTTLRQRIQRNAGCKKYEGRQLNGNDIACMIQTYVQSINNGLIPNIKTSWQQIVDNEGDIAFSMAHQKYLQIFQQHFASQQPKQQKQLYRILSSMKQQAILQYKNHSSNDNDQHYKKLKQWVKKQQQSIIQANQNATNSKNLQILKQQSFDLMKKVQSNYYNGKKQQYLDDLNKVLKNYRKNAVGDKKQTLLAEFLQTTNKISMNLQKQPQNYQRNQYLAKQAQQKMKIQEQMAKTKANQKLVNDKIDQNNNKNKNKRDDLKKKQKQKDPSKAGCCGGKCQIM